MKKFEHNRADYIVKYINSRYNIDCRLKTRKRTYCQPRQIAQYLIYYYTKLTNEENGSIFNKNHACINNSVKTVKNLYATDSDFKRELNEIENYLLPKIRFKTKYELKKHLLMKTIEEKLTDKNLIDLYKINKNLINEQRT